MKEKNTYLKKYLPFLLRKRKCLKKMCARSVWRGPLSHPISKKSYATIQEALRVGMYKKYEYYNY